MASWHRAQLLTSAVLGMALALAAAPAVLAAGPPIATAKPTSKPAATVSADKVDPAFQASARKLLGAQPGFYGSLAKLRLGMSKPQVKVAAPWLYAKKRTSYDPVLYGLSFHARRGLDGLFVHFMVPQARVERGLTAAWGTPVRCGPSVSGSSAIVSQPAIPVPVPVPGSRVSRRSPQPKPASPSQRSDANRSIWKTKAGDMQVVLQKDAKGRAEVLRYAPLRSLSAWDLSILIGMPVRQAIDRLKATRGPGGDASVGSVAHPVELAGPLGAEGLRLTWTARQKRIVGITFMLDARHCRTVWKVHETALKAVAKRLERHSVKITTVAPGRWRLQVGPSR